jgi:hypothetical protein
MATDTTATPPPRPLPTVVRIWHMVWDRAEVRLYWCDAAGVDHLTAISMDREPGRMVSVVCLDQ